MGIQLREYQQLAVEAANQAFLKHEHVLLVSSQGSGKTFMFSEIARRALRKGRRVLILSNRTKLLKQTSGALVRFGVQAEFVDVAHPNVPSGQCAVGTAQTLARRYLRPEWERYLQSVDLLIIDEAHAQDFNFLLESFLFQKKWVLGVTATPFRSGKMRQLGLDYGVIVEGLSFSEGVRMGVLSRPRYFTLDAPDLSGVGIDMIDGDFKTNEMFSRYDTPVRYEGVIRAFKTICNNEKTICFCCNQVHAIKTCLEFVKAGIPAKFLSSGLRKDHEDYHLFEENRHLTGSEDDILEEFERGVFTVLVNVAKFIAGLDVPAIVNVIFNRATRSKSLWGQAGCRGSRVFEGKDFFRVLDFGDNVRRHGLFEAEQRYSLWHCVGRESGVPSTKECPPDRGGCGRLIHSSYPKCPFCGYAFPTKREVREIELREVVGGKFELRSMTPEQLRAYAELHGYRQAWVWRQLYIGGGAKGFKKGMRQLGYENRFIYRMLHTFSLENKLTQNS